MSAFQSQYLDKAELITILPDAQVQPESTDTYDERKILQSIHEGNLNELFAIGLQFAIVGMGNRAFGSTKINGQSYNIADLAKKNNVKLGVHNSAKLEPGDLTVKRLARFFRFHISDFIEKTGQVSFLYKKYVSEHEIDPKFVFPGAEYMVTPVQAHGLLHAYSNVDKALGTAFHAKVKLIVQTRSVKMQRE